jgi:hypothetical protein
MCKAAQAEAESASADLVRQQGPADEEELLSPATEAVVPARHGLPMTAGALMLGLIAGLLVLGTHCGTAKSRTAQQPAAALKREGVDFWTSEAVSTRFKFARIDESIVLTGEGLRLEICRIESERSFKTAAAAFVLRWAFDRPDKNQGDAPGDVFVRRPFLVAITDEPAEGMVKTVLNRILPPAE